MTTRIKAAAIDERVIHDSVVGSARVARVAATRIVVRPVSAPSRTSTRARMERVCRIRETEPSRIKTSGRKTERMLGAAIIETARKIAASAPPERRATTKTKEVLTWSVTP